MGAAGQESISLIRQELPAHHDLHPIPLGIGLPRKIHIEIDGAHDAVAEFLVDKGLEGGPINADQLVEAVDERIGGNRSGQRSCPFFSSQVGVIKFRIPIPPGFARPGRWRLPCKLPRAHAPRAGR